MLCLFVINAFCGLAIWFKRSHPDIIRRAGIRFRRHVRGSDESDASGEESKKNLLIETSCENGHQSKHGDDFHSTDAFSNRQQPASLPRTLPSSYHMTSNPAKSSQSPSTAIAQRMGIVIGKFYPFHKGHELLIQTALSYVNDPSVNGGDSKGTTHVIICFRENEAPSGALRYAWIHERYPTVVLHRCYALWYCLHYEMVSMS